jgi:hypothetical protein
LCDLVEMFNGDVTILTILLNRTEVTWAGDP